jgi:hypothetical protein
MRFLYHDSWRTKVLAVTALLISSSASACWEDAAARYGVNPYLLYAIAKTESNLNPSAINRDNKNGSYDIGLMQINSRWLPTLRKYGIEESQLWDACLNIHRRMGVVGKYASHGEFVGGRWRLQRTEPGPAAQVRTKGLSKHSTGSAVGSAMTATCPTTVCIV